MLAENDHKLNERTEVQLIDNGEKNKDMNVAVGRHHSAGPPHRSVKSTLRGSSRRLRAMHILLQRMGTWLNPLNN